MSPVTCDVPLARALQKEKRAVETELRRLLRAERGIPDQLRRAMAYSLFAGGKRLRPALLMWTYDALLGRRRRGARLFRAQALSAAGAVEMIHTYSLIHDDLPAMDDDDLRRGRPTCHVAFGEATAILAGDGLQALAFAVLGRLGAEAAAAVTMLAESSGPGGMVGGQQEDLLAQGGEISAAVVRRIHLRKTAALIAAAMGIGAHLAAGSSQTVAHIRQAGLDLGLAFQGADDLLDVTATAQRLGKTAGKDAVAGKATWVRLEGLAAAQARTDGYGRRGVRRLARVLPAGPAAQKLLALAAVMWNRDR